MGLIERRALKRCEALISADRLPDETVIDFEIGSDLTQRIDLIVTNRALWLLKDQEQTLSRFLYAAIRAMTWEPVSPGTPEGQGRWILTVTMRDPAPVETILVKGPRPAIRKAIGEFEATLDDLGSRLVEALGQGGARDLLDALTRSEADRAKLIGRLSIRNDATWLAELLIDIEVDESIRLQVTDALARVMRSRT